MSEEWIDRCNEPMHKGCRCIRPDGHDGEHNCAYVNSAPDRTNRSEETR